ncbi:MAG: hypothetical protein HXS52_01380 [Theionarchaea archaeon]|nr:hypothetical protein [Theionarchaea archaeon]MBU7036554.1 hypothetical protein [Theionarchaea archaeon]
MIWILIILGFVLMAAIIALFLKSGRYKQSEEAKARGFWSVWMGVGGAIGAVIGILLVELADYSYPLPAILWMMGMAAGQVGGILYSRYR